MTDNPSPSDIRQEDVRELLPCPFCGSEAVDRREIDGFPMIYCDGEGCFGPQTTAKSFDDALLQWNTRAVLSAQTGEPVEPDDLEELIQDRSSNRAAAAILAAYDVRHKAVTPPPQPDTAPSSLSTEEGSRDDWGSRTGIACRHPDGPDECDGCPHYQDPKRNPTCRWAAALSQPPATEQIRREVIEECIRSRVTLKGFGVQPDDYLRGFQDGCNAKAASIRALAATEQARS